MAQLVRAPPCHGGGRRFEPDLGRFLSKVNDHRGCCLKEWYGVIAQLGEHLPYKQGVTGSSPVGPILFIYAGVAELADARDLKSRVG